MKRTDIEVALEAARKDMEEALQEKMLVELRVGQLAQTINALSSLLTVRPAEIDVPEEVFGESGITAAIRVLLTRSKVPLAPVQIRTELMSHSFDLSDYANAMAVIHNTLKRLDKQGELMTVKNSSGQIIAYTTRFKSLPPLGTLEDSLRNVLKADRIAKAKDALRKK